ncbi:hypothetical protein AAMO2058_001045600 [Amorphochlora amoebiformis]
MRSSLVKKDQVVPKEENDKCSICLRKEIHDRACISSCLHSFCLECIEKWTEIQLTSSSAQKKLRCPLCKSSYTHILHDIQADSEYSVRDYSADLRRVNRPENQQQPMSSLFRSPPPRYRRRRHYEWGVGLVESYSPSLSSSTSRAESLDGNLGSRLRLYETVRRQSDEDVLIPAVRVPRSHIRDLLPWLEVELQAIAETLEPDAVLVNYVISIFEQREEDLTRSGESFRDSRDLLSSLRPFFLHDGVVAVFLDRLARKARSFHPLFLAAQAWRNEDSKLNSSAPMSQTRAMSLPRSRSRLIVEGHYGPREEMNGEYRALCTYKGGFPAYVKTGRGTVKGGEEWKWMIRYYQPKRQWKIDFYPTLRDTDNCFAYITSSSALPVDAEGTWGIWNGHTWLEDPGIRLRWISGVSMRSLVNSDFARSSSSRDAKRPFWQEIAIPPRESPTERKHSKRSQKGRNEARRSSGERRLSRDGGRSSRNKRRNSRDTRISPGDRSALSCVDSSQDEPRRRLKRSRNKKRLRKVLGMMPRRNLESTKSASSSTARPRSAGSHLRGIQAGGVEAGTRQVREVEVEQARKELQEVEEELARARAQMALIAARKRRKMRAVV